MEDKEWFEIVQQLEKKLARAQKRGAVLYQKAKLLEEIAQMAKRYEEDARTREQDANSLIKQLITRQRELNVMLNRSNTLIARMYEANQVLSLEFQEAAKALPAPQREKLEQKVSEKKAIIDDLFRKTGIPEAQTSTSPENENKSHEQAGDSFRITEGGTRSRWNSPTDNKPPVVEAEPVGEHTEGEFTIRPEHTGSHQKPVEPMILDADDEEMGSEISEDRRRKWWARFGFGSTSD